MKTREKDFGDIHTCSTAATKNIAKPEFNRFYAWPCRRTFFENNHYLGSGCNVWDFSTGSERYHSRLHIDEAIFYDFRREKILTPRNSPKYFLWIQSKMESAGEDILAVLNCIGEKNDEIRVCFIHSQYIQSTSKYQLTPPTLRTLRLCTSLLLYLLRQHGLFLFMASQK